MIVFSGSTARPRPQPQAVPEDNLLDFSVSPATSDPFNVIALVFFPRSLYRFPRLESEPGTILSFL